MFRVHKKLLYNFCCGLETPKSLRLNFMLYKSFLAVQDYEQKLKCPIVGSSSHDAIDAYTNTVVLENITKWKTNSLQNSKKMPIIKSSSIFKACDDPDHLITYLQQCLDGNCKVSKSVLVQFMLTMAKHGRVNGLALIEKLNVKYKYCIEKSELQINFAEAYWTNGNLNCMFKIFETFYPTESMKANYLLQPIIYTIVKSRGIASVVMVSKFANSIIMKHADYHPMCILWKNLFLSELYNDNLEADKLLQKHRNLIEHIQYLVPVITNNMLKKHKIDCVQRLMMILLKYNQMTLYKWILRSLFEYYCKYFHLLSFYIHLLSTLTRV